VFVYSIRIFLVKERPINKAVIPMMIMILHDGDVAGIGKGVGVGVKITILRSSIYQPLKSLFSASTVSNRNLILAGLEM